MLREPLQIVEIDTDTCALTYGTGACAAVLGTTGQAKCFNTFRTCQDQDNFDKATLPLRFAKNVDGIPRGQTVFPALQSVSTNATRINIAGVDDELGSLGRRERVTVRLKDFTYQDSVTDKYQAQRVSGSAQASGIGYNPTDRGTFFGRLRARNPFYFGRGLRVRNGFVGDDLASMRTRHYVIDSWSGPDVAGNVTIVAKDALSLADNEKAQCPKPSGGKLAADIDSTETTFTLTPDGSEAGYPASGLASIGDEIVGFTRSGATVTLTGRGLRGTTAQSHSELDTFQLCYVADNLLISEAIAELLTDYAGVDPSYIDQAAWDAETERWLAGMRLDTVIPKPTGVLTLLAEVAFLGASIWWDGVGQQIRYRLNRLVDVNDEIISMSDAANVLEGSISTADRPDLRLSQVVLYHDMIDFSGSVSNPENYRKAQATVDLESEGPNEYNQSQYRTFFSRWIKNGSDSAARDVATRALFRYREVPTDATFQVDVKDIDSVELGNILDLTTRVLQDETGQATPTEMQIIEYEETVPGHRVRVVAQTFAFRGRYGFITENGRGSYLVATDAQKRVGTYIAADANGFADATQAYQIY